MYKAHNISQNEQNFVPNQTPKETWMKKITPGIILTARGRLEYWFFGKSTFLIQHAVKGLGCYKFTLVKQAQTRLLYLVVQY